MIDFWRGYVCWFHLRGTDVDSLMQRATVFRARNLIDEALKSAAREDGVTVRDAVRGVIAKHFRLEPDEISGRWGEISADRIAKASAINLIDNPTLAGPAAQALFAPFVEQSVLRELRQVEPRIRMLGVDDTVADFVAEGRAIPVRSSVASGRTLRLLHKVGAIHLVTREAFEAGGPLFEQGLEQALTSALSLAVDRALLDPNNTGGDDRPASITSAGIEIPSSGSDSAAVRADLRTLVSVFARDWMNTFWVMNPQTLIELALMQDSLGESDLKVTGGTLLGLPIICTRGCPITSSGASLSLIDRGAVAWAGGAVTVTEGRSVTLQLDDLPSGHGSAPEAGVAETQVISAWQNNVIALRAIASVDWELQAEGGVATLTGVSYTGAS